MSVILSVFTSVQIVLLISFPIYNENLRILNRKSSSIPSLQDENNATIESNTGKANALNSFFHRCFNYTFPSLIEFPEAFEMSLPPNECPKQLLSTEESVYDLLITLDTCKSTGCDGVSASMLKQTACSIALPLSKLINLSLSTGQVPYEWKLASQSQSLVKTRIRLLDIDQYLYYPLHQKL